MFILYNIIINIFGPLVVLITFLNGRYGGFWLQRLGFYPKLNKIKNNRYLFQAASVGEVKSAASVILNLFKKDPQAEFFVAVGTPAGIKISQKLFKKYPNITTLPTVFDFFFSPQRALKRLKASHLIIIETEIWPNLIHSAKKNKLKIVLAAARLSNRSFKHYLYIKTFMKQIFANFNYIYPIGDLENTRFVALGANKTKILGSPKYDFLIEQASSAEIKKTLLSYQNKIWPKKNKDNLLLVAGSTHQGEEEILINCFLEIKKEFTKLKLILVPRHLKRINNIEKLLKAKNITYATINAENLNDKEVIIANKMGLLFTLYGLSNVSFIGGSLTASATGHNPLEAAAFQKAIVFGPNMSSFQNVVDDLLKKQGAIEVQEKNITENLLFLFKNPQLRQQYGQNAFELLQNKSQVGAKIAQEILCI